MNHQQHLRKQYLSAGHLVKHYYIVITNDGKPSKIHSINKLCSIYVMHIFQVWILWMVVGPKKKSGHTVLQHLFSPLFAKLTCWSVALPLSPSLLPPPSLDASLRAGGPQLLGPLVVGPWWREGWPGTRLGPWALPASAAPPHHCKQPPLSTQIHLSTLFSACKCLEWRTQHVESS